MGLIDFARFSGSELQRVGKFLQEGMKDPKSKTLQDEIEKLIQNGGYSWKQSLAAVANLQLSLLFAFRDFMRNRKDSANGISPSK